jgi:hypothetical protein
VLSIPATGAGVERLFNTARDICHYRRGSLNATTIQELMLYRCATQFEVEEDDIAFWIEYLSKGEIEADHEEKDAQQLEGTVDPISDDEESNAEDTQEDLVLVQAQSATQGPSKRAPRKRRIREMIMSYLHVQAEARPRIYQLLDQEPRKAP